MTPPVSPVTYVEVASPDQSRSAAFFRDVFGWECQAFASPYYLVAAGGDAGGVDVGMMASRDGQPRAIPVPRVESLAEASQRVAAAGGQVVVEPFTITGVGYVVDPVGVLLGLHEYDADA